MKIVTIIGARPQFIKAAIISRELENYKNINEIIIHTGQHYDSNMSDIFFKQMGIPYPNYNLSIGGGTHGQMTGRQIEEIEKLKKEQEHLFNENTGLKTTIVKKDSAFTEVDKKKRELEELVDKAKGNRCCYAVRGSQS